LKFVFNSIIKQVFKRKKMKKTVLLLALIAIVLGSNAQPHAKISFANPKHDFGQLKAESGSIKHKFEFTNTGNQHLLINEVKSSCGCTSPDWTRQPIAPGGKGFIIAEFDPKDEHGTFDKSLTVISNALESPSTLRITGTVASNDVNVLFPELIGDLRLESKRVSIAKIGNSETLTQTLKVYNQSAKALQISFAKLPPHLTVKAVPSSLNPKQEGKIEIVFNAAKKSDWGFVKDDIALLLNSTNQPNNLLTISANIKEDFSKLTKDQLAIAPKIEVANANYDFGTVKSGQIVEYTFTVKNIGKNDLLLRKASSLECAVEVSQTTIPAGKSATIKAKFNTKDLKGKKNAYINVISNAPDNSLIKLKLSGVIE